MFDAVEVVMSSFELRLIPTKVQRVTFMEILKDSRETYNAALQERSEAWKLQRKSISYNDQCAELTELRKDSRFAVIALDVQREPLRRIDKAMKAFFRRVKAGQKPGFPRFRGRDSYDSFAWHGPRIRANTIRVPNVGEVRFKIHRPIVGQPKQITVKLVGGNWVARLVCDIGQAPAKRVVSSAIGIDLGLTTFATLSNSEEIPNPRFGRKAGERIAAAQRQLSTKKRGSKNRLKAKEVARRAYQRAVDARKNFCHHVSKALVERFDLIAHEDLQITNMAGSAKGTVEQPGTNVAQKAGLNRSIMDAAWGQMLFQLAYKAERAGVHVVAVNPRNTSQMCSGCGAIVRKKLSERTHLCSCGLTLGRDHNAAINVLRLGRSLAATRVASEGSL